MTEIHTITVMMCLYQCMSMDVKYNFRQPKNPLLIGTLFVFKTMSGIIMGTQRRKTTN
jgi:hypothetical protein